MNTTRLLLLLLLILVAVVIVLVVLRRGSAQRDQQRAEAAGLRSEAETIAASMGGQSAFADQAAERAEVARAEAEQKARDAEQRAREAQEQAREAERLEAEAAQHRAAVESTQREYETTMRRADDIDPDVKESQFPAVDETGSDAPATTGGTPTDEPAPVASGAADAVSAPPADGVRHDDGTAEPMTRAERREAREAADESGAQAAPAGEDATATGWSAPAAASAVPAAGAVGAAAAGASAWSARGDEAESRESERIASAADYRDDLGGGPTDVAGERTDVVDEPTDVADEPADVSRDGMAGSGAGMSEQTRTDETEHTSQDRGASAGGAVAGASDQAFGGDVATDSGHVDGPAADAATTPDSNDSTATRHHGDATSRDATDLSHDVESPRGEWGGPRRDDEAAEMTIIADPEAYATTEPVMASEQSPPVSPEPVAGTDAGSGSTPARDADTADAIRTVEPSAAADVPADAEHDPAADTATDGTAAHDSDGRTSDDRGGDGSDLIDGTDHAPAETGAAVAETDGTDRNAAAAEPAGERFDATPTRDWAADEGDLLEENRDRGERLEHEREDLAAEAGRPAGAPASGDDQHVTDRADSEQQAADDQPVPEQPAGRRISAFEEIRDGGFGVGSAAPLGDGAQPLDHPVAGFRDMTYRAPGDAGYDSAEPDVWFYDEGAAERSGFRRAGG